MSLNIADAITQLENQINALQEDLTRYKTRIDASEKFVFFKQQQIEILKTSKAGIIDFIETTNAQILQQQKEIGKLKNQKFKLEGICFLHGISNVLSYLNQPEKTLIKTVTDALKNNWRQTPADILNADTEIKKEIKRVKFNAVPFTDLKNKALENL
jgi:chromosome segregation ATPase